MEFKEGTSLPQPSKERIEWFEKTYRVVLPFEYVQLLKTGNGAVPLTSMFFQGQRDRIIERFLCFLESPRNDQRDGWADITVVMSQIDARLIDNEDSVGMNIIPFAALFGGDMLCLNYRHNSQVPEIAVWDHERSEDFHPQLEKIAETFGQFEVSLQTP